MSIFKHITERITIKKSDYNRYNFTKTENSALKTFFDLAQEFSSIEDFYNLCVAIPKEFFDLEARLYLADPGTRAFMLKATSEETGFTLDTSAPANLLPAVHPYYTAGNSLVLTIRGKKMQIEKLLFHLGEDVLALLELFPVHNIDAHKELFFEKFANRIGFNLHNRFLVAKNIEHLDFIRSLVADIEHNVIVPNMVYKLFLRHLRFMANKTIDIEKRLSEHSSVIPDNAFMDNIVAELSDINSDLSRELDNIEMHYKNMTLFIETLFRKSHFDQGRLVLRTKPCNIKKEVLEPQLDRYREQFTKAGIMIDDRVSGIPEEQIVNVVDVGLMSQVFANLFSNALKYTRSVKINSEEKKFMAYGYEIIRDYFGAGKDGSKYNVFTTGPHIPEKERPSIFEEDFRGYNARDIPGTGHGLTFIKNVIEIHGGVTGYEPKKHGNNFYFILP
jgi:signal transduction histidine kinase